MQGEKELPQLSVSGGTIPGGTDISRPDPWIWPQGKFDFLCQYLIQDPLVWNSLRRDLCNLLIPMSGECTVGDGRQWLVIHRGEILLCKPQEKRVFKQYGIWTTYWFLFVLQCPIYWSEPIPGFYLLRPDHKTYRRMLRDAIDAYRIASVRQGDWFPLAMSLIETLIQRGNFFSRTEETDARIVKAAALLEQPGLSMDLDEVARACGYSRASFYKKFKLLYGMTPHEYREREQLFRVESLLQLTDITISEIAKQTAFPNVCYLSRRFRKVFGITPTEARRRAQNKA